MRTAIAATKRPGAGAAAPLLLLLAVSLLCPSSAVVAFASTQPPRTRSPHAEPGATTTDDELDAAFSAAECDPAGQARGQAEGWDVGRYQSQHGFVWKHGMPLLDLLDARPGERVLDVGCGSGELTKAIASAADDVTAIGMDADAGMIQRAGEQFPSVEFFVGDVREFELDQPVDAVFSNAALHWVPPPDVDRSVASMARALKRGGRFVVEFGGRGNVRSIVEAAKEAVPGAECPWYFPSVAEYATVLERHGIEVQEATLYDRPTVLEDEEDGIKDWLRMFGGSFFQGLDEEAIDAALDRIQEKLKPRLHDGTRWVADYRRIRIVGRKM